MLIRSPKKFINDINVISSEIQHQISRISCDDSFEDDFELLDSLENACMQLNNIVDELGDNQHDNNTNILLEFVEKHVNRYPESTFLLRVQQATYELSKNERID